MEPVCINTVRFDDHIREEWTITSEPGYKVPLFLLKPLNQTGPVPLVPRLTDMVNMEGYLCRDTITKKTAKVWKREKRYCTQAVREGYIAIAMDQRGLRDKI